MIKYTYSILSLSPHSLHISMDYSCNKSDGEEENIRERAKMRDGGTKKCKGEEM